MVANDVWYGMEQNGIKRNETEGDDILDCFLILQSKRHTVEILEVVCNSGLPISISDISVKLGIKRGTVHKRKKLLVEMGLIKVNVIKYARSHYIVPTDKGRMAFAEYNRQKEEEE